MWNLALQAQEEGWGLLPGEATATTAFDSMVTDAWSRLQNSNELQAYREATGKDIRMVMIPSLDDATTPASFLKPAMFWCVSADSDVKDAAVRFINFFTNIMNRKEGKTEMIKSITHSFSAQRKIGTFFYHALMIVVSFLMLYPVLWLVASSFKPNGDIFSTATSLFPENFTLEHYINGWKGFGGYTFTTFFSNSLLVALLSAVGMMASSALVAFGLARIKFKGRNIWFVLMVVTMMLPGQVMMIPRFVLFNSMGWVGTYLPMIVPSFFASGFNIFLIMQFIRGIPRDMDEAAKIDGCSWYGVFFRIIVPMIVPSLVTVAVLTFMSSWEDFMGALLYLNKPETYTVAYALKMFNDSSMSDYGATFAMSAASLVPILVLFFFFQKNLVEGISIQGLKG